MTDKKNTYDKRLYNTKLLLRNYRKLKQHYDSAVSSIDEIEHDEVTNEIIEGFGTNSPTYIKSILRTKGRTIVIVKHIDRLIGHYKITSMTSGGEELRRFNVIDGLYLSDDKVSMEILAEINNCSLSTVKRDHSKAIEELSVLLFGIDGVILWE